MELQSHRTFPVEAWSETHRGACRVCGRLVALRVDFGGQPLCNRLLLRPSDHERKHPLRLGQCVACGLLQLIEPISAAELKPARLVRYTEPESHLDQVADLISKLPGVGSQSPICGITNKDQSTIARLQARGFHDARCLCAGDDLAIEDPAAGIETIQQQISNGALDNRAIHRGRYRVVIARHILEHAHSLNRFVAELRLLLAPGGYLVFEVPDFTTSLLNGDYSTLWEEHVVYFTGATLTLGLGILGLDVQQLQTYPYMPEDSLVAVATPTHVDAEGKPRVLIPLSECLDQKLALARHYTTRLPDIRQLWREKLAGERSAGRQVALLGAGHLGIMFINVMNLADAIDVVVDDDPDKCGKYLPGSHHLIHELTALDDRRIDLCLLAVSPEGEERVLERHRGFVDRGGRFRSIFPRSRLACMPGPIEIPATKD